MRNINQGDQTYEFYGESNVHSSALSIKAGLFLSALPLHLSVSSYLHLSLPNQMPLQILPFRPNSGPSLLLPCNLWRAQVCNPNPPYHLLVPCLFLGYPPFFELIFLQFWHLIMLFGDFRKWVFVFVLRLLDGLE